MVPFCISTFLLSSKKISSPLLDLYMYTSHSGKIEKLGKNKTHPAILNLTANSPAKAPPKPRKACTNTRKTTKQSAKKGKNTREMKILPARMSVRNA